MKRDSTHYGSFIAGRVRSARRRGSVFVLVLGVTALVTVIGMSAMLAVRLQHRGSRDRADATQAQLVADSAMQIIHARLSASSNWRADYSNNTWTNTESLDATGSFRFRLVDETDGNLGDDSDDPVRLTVRAEHGSAVRLASIELRSGVTLGPELLTNADMEAGATGYGLRGSGSVNVWTDTPHGGTMYLQIEGRSSAGDALAQSVINKVASGKTYRLAGWVRMENTATSARLGIYSTALLGSSDHAYTAAAGTGWTYVHGQVTPSLALLAGTVGFYVSTVSTTQDIHADDLSVREVLSTSMPVVRGSYRRELDP